MNTTTRYDRPYDEPLWKTLLVVFVLSVLAWAALSVATMWAVHHRPHVATDVQISTACVVERGKPQECN